MKRILGMFAAFIIAASISAQSPIGIAPPKGVDSASIDEYLSAKVKQSGAVGLSVAVYRDGLPIIAKVYGSTAINGAPLRSDTAFAIGSITKQFACAATLLLHEEGKLFYKDSIAKYYPDLPRANDITIYDLMTHTSGYRDYYPLDFIDRRMLKPITPDTLIRQYCTTLDFEPGTRWSYSNTGYVLLGRIIEKASNEPLGKYLERAILKPLRMDHSTFEPAADAANVAKGHTAVLLGAPEAVPMEAPQWLHAAGGLYCTASDLAKWNLALMSGRLLRPDSYEVMIKPRELKDGRVHNYGCGLSVTRADGDLVLSHSGAVSGFHAYNSMIPRTKSLVVVLCNDEHVDIASIHRELVNLLLRDQARKNNVVPKVATSTAKDAAIQLFKQMQDNNVDRSQVGEEFNIYLTETRLREAAPRLKALGEPTNVEVQGLHERGGMEASTVRFIFPGGVIKASMFRSADGKIQQFLLNQG